MTSSPLRLRLAGVSGLAALIGLLAWSVPGPASAPGAAPVAGASASPVDYYRTHFQLPTAGLGAVAACFDQGTSDDVVNYVGGLLGQINSGERYNLSSRWSGSQGTPRALTWSFVPDGLNISNGVGEGDGPSTLFASMDTKFAALGGRAYWIARVQACFDRWAQLTGLSYTRVTFGGNDWDDGAFWGSTGAAGLRGDVRVSAKQIDNGSGILAYNFFPSSGGDMVLDEDESWAQGTANNHRFMRNIILHEHGHGMGLQHVCPTGQGKLMEPFLSTVFDGPRLDDLRAAQRHYGDDYGIINTPALAADAGTVNIGTPVTIGAIPPPAISTSGAASIDGDGEVDYFKFTVTGRRSLAVTLAPQGTTYDSSAQSCSGQPASCCSGNTINSLTMANLNVQVLDTNGITPLATGDSQPAGTNEVIPAVLLPFAGTYYIRVYEGDAPTQSQLYTVTLAVRSTVGTDSGTTEPGPIGP
jgi:hypothetical protein